MLAHNFVVIATVLPLLLVAASAPAAQLSVGAGSSISLGESRLDLGCADLTVEGSVSLTTGTIEGGRDFSGSGVLDAGTGLLRLAGDWLSGSGFAKSNATVEFVDGCGRTASTILGENTWGGLQLLTSMGKYFAFDANRTQTVLGWFDFQGTSGSPAIVRSTVAGLAAVLDLAGHGLGGADAIDVDDIDVVQGIASIDPGSTLGPNTSGWTSPTNVPATPPLAVLVAAFGLLALAGRLITSRTGTGPA